MWQLRQGCCEQNRVCCRGLCDLPDPGAAGFIGIAFHQGAGVDVIIGHNASPRWAWMTSLSDGPDACERMARTSSRVTPGIILLRRVLLSGRRRPAAARTSRAVVGCAAS